MEKQLIGKFSKLLHEAKSIVIWKGVKKSFWIKWIDFYNAFHYI
jgi:hypothetical protein